MITHVRKWGCVHHDMRHTLSPPRVDGVVSFGTNSATPPVAMLGTARTDVSALFEGRRESGGLRALNKVVNSRKLVEVAVGVAFDIELCVLASLAGEWS